MKELRDKLQRQVAGYSHEGVQDHYESNYIPHEEWAVLRYESRLDPTGLHTLQCSFSALLRENIMRQKQIRLWSICIQSKSKYTLSISSLLLGCGFLCDIQHQIFHQFALCAIIGYCACVINCFCISDSVGKIRLHI